MVIGSGLLKLLLYLTESEVKMTSNTKKSAVNEASKKVDSSWQAQKSAMTRNKILDAAINAFITLGYTNVTTAKVANMAGVSRGAMLHHFPSKTELINSAVEYLHEKLLKLYTKLVSATPKDIEGREYRRAGLNAYWKYLTSDLFTAYHELWVAGRTDPELHTILMSSIGSFEEHVVNSNMDLFKEWRDHGEKFTLAMDLAKFLMEGMAMGHIVANREERIARLLDYLADRLEEIFQEGADKTNLNSAINRHS